MFSLLSKSDSDFLNICNRELASDFNRNKLLNQFKETYRRAPYFPQTFTLIEQIVNYKDNNLFAYPHHSIARVCEHLHISVQIEISSGIAIDHNLTGQNKVLALCAAIGATTYVNAMGGLELYCRETFRERGIDLKFIQSKPFNYSQYENEFVPWLSIIDVRMFNPIDKIQSHISTNYELI